MGSKITALKSCWSATQGKVEAEGADIGRKPQRFSTLKGNSIRSWSRAKVKPHPEGEAYIKKATVVALATSCNRNCNHKHQTSKAPLKSPSAGHELIHERR